MFTMTGDRAGKKSLATLAGEFLLFTFNPTSSSVVIKNIPPRYKNLRLIITGRGDASATFVTTNITINGDTGSNYDYAFSGPATPTTANGIMSYAQTSEQTGAIVAATGPANTPGYVDYLFYDYTNTIFHKLWDVSTAVKIATSGNGLFPRRGNGWWRSTSAINRIDITLSSGNFITGSVVKLYGRL